MWKRFIGLEWPSQNLGLREKPLRARQLIAVGISGWLVEKDVDWVVAKHYTRH